MRQVPGISAKALVRCPDVALECSPSCLVCCCGGQARSGTVDARVRGGDPVISKCCTSDCLTSCNIPNTAYRAMSSNPYKGRIWKFVRGSKYPVRQPARNCITQGTLC